MTIHFVLGVVKKSLDENAWGLVFLLAVIGTFAANDYYGWISYSSLSEKAFGYLLQAPAMLFAFCLMPIISYFIAYRFFMRGLYADELSVRDRQKFHTADWFFLERFGDIGAWIRIELKLIARHRRTRAVFMVGIPFFLSLIIMLSRMENPNAYGIFLGIGIMGTGMLAMNYGQFLFSWQGHHFDVTLTRPISLRRFVESKYWLLAAVIAFSFLVSLPLIYFGWMVVLANFVACLYNIGVNTFIMMNMSMWGAGRISLYANGHWNYEGLGAAQWLIFIPFLLSPYIIFLPFNWAGYPVTGLLAVGIVGLIGIALRSQLLDITTRRLAGMRHALSSNFRRD